MVEIPFLLALRTCRLLALKVMLGNPKCGQGEYFVYNPPRHGVDNLGEAEVDDTHTYIVKDDRDGKFVRASEWFCKCVSEYAGFPVPQPAVLQRAHDKRTLFGSRKLSGVASEMRSWLFLLMTDSPIGPKSVVSKSQIISKLYSLDMALHNDDRHAKNYLFIDEFAYMRLYVMDFSRSFFYHWPVEAFPQATSNTRVCGRMLLARHGFDLAAAEEVIDRLEALSTARVVGYLNEFPQDWLPSAMRTEVVSKWESGWWGARLEKLREGLRDGNLL